MCDTLRVFEKFIRLAYSAISALYSIHTTVNLMCFLSEPKISSIYYNWIFDLSSTESRLKNGMIPLLFDGFFLLMLFVIHGVLQSVRFRNLLRKCGFGKIHIALSAMLFSSLLRKVISIWKPVKSVVFWYVDLEKNEQIWYAFVGGHVLAWLILLTTSPNTDFIKMMGAKHVVDEMMDYDDKHERPLKRKLLHLSFFSLLFILWGVNVMSLDRLILSTAFTIFMFKRWYYKALKREQLQTPHFHED